MGLADWRGDVALELWVEVDVVPVRIRLAGRLDATTAANLDEVVRELLADGTREIELCTDGLRVVDASAIGTLADVERRVRARRRDPHPGGPGQRAVHPHPPRRRRRRPGAGSRPDAPGTARPPGLASASMPDRASGRPLSVAEEYPAGLDVDERLRDGIARPVPPHPRHRRRRPWTAFHESLSPRSVYRRFFFAHPRLSPGEVERFTHVDYVDRMAFVVVDGDRIVGVGRYERLAGTDEAEVAFVVTDDLPATAGSAPCCSTTSPTWPGATASHRFVAQTLSENRDMLGRLPVLGIPGDDVVRRRDGDRPLPDRPVRRLRPRPAGGRRARPPGRRMIRPDRRVRHG